jgi:hypothetical protein
MTIRTTLKPAYSFVVDEDPIFAYQAWHLAKSLVQRCAASASEIFIQCTPQVRADTRRVFERAGYCVQTLARFGDGKYCNKIGQLDNLSDIGADIVVLLDTDTLAVGDLRPWLKRDAVLGKIVDAANPPLQILDQITEATGLASPGPVCDTDSGDGQTYAGNFNGGMYSIPREHCAVMSREWRRWALWLLDNIELLRRARKESHVDQVAFWLALRSSGVPFQLAPSNLNYFIHFEAPHRYVDDSREIALIHYHNACLNVLGKLEPPTPQATIAQEAIKIANELIGQSFHNELFWDYRYRHWPERGSGIGSRGENLQYKRALLRAEGIESASSVLDVGCGDLEVLKDLRLNQYIGVDVSPVALERARAIRPSGDAATPECPSPSPP